MLPNWSYLLTGKNCKIFHGPNISNFNEIYDYLKSLGVANKINNIEYLPDSYHGRIFNKALNYYKNLSDSGILLSSLNKPVNIEEIKKITPWIYKNPVSPAQASIKENKFVDFKNACKVDVADF